MSGLIHHLAPAGDYQPGQPYLPRQFAQDGFIHCTREPEVLLHIANAFYREAPGDFEVLDIAPERLTAELRYEPPVPTPAPSSPLHGTLFPHIYGPLNPEAVVAVRPARREPGGGFISV